MKRITKKAWFGKKYIGWGVRPASLEGWLVTVAFIIAIFVNEAYNKNTATSYAIIAVISIIFIVIICLTGDTPGSEAWDKLRNKKMD